MYKVVQAIYTLWLLLCVAGSLWGSTADEPAVTDSTVVQTAFQNLTTNATAASPTVPGFSPYPQFIDGQTPSGPDSQQQHEVSERCSPAAQCSNTAEQLEAQQSAATPASLGDSEQHAASQPATQQPTQQQQAPSTVHQQHTASAASASASDPTATAQSQAATTASLEAQLQAPTTTPVQEPTTATPTTAAVLQEKEPPLPPVRPLLNLALLSDGANVLAANAEARRPERAIDKDIDSFMKNDCNADKWVMIELSQLGTVETVKLTMKELYSSRVNTFRVFGRSSHPRKDAPDLTASINSEAWQLLGTFTAENKRGTQSFTLPQRSRVRYVLVRFDTHYGSEAMCALNVIEVLGVSAAQELEEALALQEESEAEELFQHMQQQHEEEEQMQQQLHPPALEHLHQQQQQLTVSANRNGDNHHAALDTNDSAPVAVSQQSQQDGHIVVMDMMGAQRQEGQQQLAPQPAASSAASPQQDAAAVDRSSGLTPTSQGFTASTGVQQQQSAVTPDALAEAADQDIIAIPVVPDPAPQTSAALDQPAQQVANEQQQEAVVSPGGITAMPTGAAGLLHSSNGSPPIQTAVHVADGVAQQQQLADAPAAPAQGAPSPQLTTQQQSHPAVVQPAEQTFKSTPAAAGPLGGGSRIEVEANSQATANLAGDNAATPAIVAAGPTSTNGHTPSSGQPVVTSPSAPASAPVRLSSSPIPVVQLPPVPQQLPAAAAPAQQQLPAAASPAQQQPQQKQSSREAVLAGGTAKPKQAGNLFDIIKSEMMQLKLEQGKVSKKLEGLSKRGSEADVLAVHLQEQQGRVMDRLDTLTLKVDSLANQLSRAEILYQYNTQQHGHQHHAGGGMQGGMDPLGGIPHSHRGHQHPHGVHVASGTSSAVPRHMPVCQGEVVAVPLMLQSQYMWVVVGLLAGSAVLGLLVMFLHPSVSKMSSVVKAVMLALALLNLLLAALLCMYLLLEGLLVRYQQAFRKEYMFDTFVTVPQHRMITNGSR